MLVSCHGAIEAVNFSPYSMSNNWWENKIGKPSCMLPENIL